MSTSFKSPVHLARVWLLEEVRSSDHLNPFVGSSCGRSYHCDKILTIFSPSVLLWCPVTCLFDHYEKLDAPHFMRFGCFVFNLCVVHRDRCVVCAVPRHAYLSLWCGTICVRPTLLFKANRRNVYELAGYCRPFFIQWQFL